MESSIATAELSIFLFADPKAISCHQQHPQQILDSRQLVDIFNIAAADSRFGPENRIFDTENAAVGPVRGASNTVVLDIRHNNPAK